MLVHPSPGFALWPAAMIAWGPGFISTPHRHHSVQLVMVMQGTLRVRGPGEEWRECGAAIIRADARHEVDARGGTTLIAFFDAESEVGAAIVERTTGSITPVSARQVAHWREALGSPLSEARVEAWVRDSLLKRRRPTGIDPRVEKVLTQVRQRVQSEGDLSLNSLASGVGLSASRLMHLFTESVGVPLRPYIRWLRVQVAACELMEGATISAAAHRAGFSDAAHLTRTFRSTMGATPSDIALRTRLSRGVSLPATDVRAETSEATH